MTEPTETKSEKKSGRGCLIRLLAVLIILVVAIFVLAKILFPAERVRAEIVKRASEKLHRQVELDAVSFSLLPLPTVQLQGLRIYNPEDFPGPALVSVDRLECAVRLWPLLRKRFEFTDVSVVHPVLNLRKLADGRTNYRFAVDISEQPASTEAGEKKSISSAEAAMATFSFDWAEIQGGDLIYVDDSAQTKTTLNNFSLETRLTLTEEGRGGHSQGSLIIPTVTSDLIPNQVPLHIELSYNADIDFQNADLTVNNTSLTINGISFDLEATVRNLAAPQSVFARLKADHVAIEPLLGYLPPMESLDREKLRLSGTLSGALDAHLEIGSGRLPRMNGNLSLNDFTFGYQTIAMRCHFDALNLAFDFDSVSFHSQGGSLSDREFSLAGKIKKWSDPEFTLATKGTYDLAGVVPFLDQSLRHQLSGTVRFDLSVSGKKSEWAKTKLEGAAFIDRLFYTNDSLTAPLERLDMGLTFGSTVTVDTLYLAYPGVRATMTGTVSNGFAHLLEPRKGHKKPYLKYRLKSPLVNYDLLIPPDEEPAPVAASPAGPAGGQGKGQPAPQQIVAAPPIFIPDIEASGTVSIDTLIFRELVFTEVTGEATYDLGIINYKNARGRIYSGQVKAEGMVDFTDMVQPLVTSEFDAQGVEADEVMGQFAGLRGHLFGKVNLKGRLAGRGAEPIDFIRTVNAEGNASMQEGRVVNFALINKLAEQFGFKTFEEESIHDLVTDIIVKDGRMVFDGTKLLTRVGDWNIGGTVAIVDKNLDLGVSLYLSEKYAREIKLFNNLLLDDKNRLRINFGLTGAIDSPKISNVSTDTKALEKKAGEEVKKGVKKLIDGLIKKK